DIRWVLASDTQALSATVDDLPLSIAVSKTGALEHELFLSTAAATIGTSLDMSEAGISIRGTQAFNLTDWMPLALLAGIVPENVRIDTGGGRAEFDINIPFDTDTSPVIAATVVPTSTWRVLYGEGIDDVVALIAASDEPFTIHATFPEVGWDISRKQAGLTVSASGWREIPVNLTDLRCRSGVRCSMVAAISMRNAELPIGTTAAFEWSSTLDVVVDDEATRLGIEPGADLRFQQLAGETAVIAALEAQFVSAAELTATKDGWSIVADSVDGRVERLAMTDDSTASAAVFFENFSASDSGGQFTLSTAVYAPSSKVTVLDTTISAPGFRGTVSIDGSVVMATLETIGLQGEAAIEAVHDTDSGIGQISLDGAIVAFGKRTLAERFAPWPYAWSVSGGTTYLSFDAKWDVPAATVTAASIVQFEDLAGFYDDIAFTGFSTALDAEYSSETGISIAPAEMSLALVDVGLPLENISARYRLDVSAQAVDVEALRMEAFGGVIRADPFSFHTAAESNNLVLNAERIDLAELMSMQDFEAVNVAGTISAVLPVTIFGDRIIVEGGTLTGEAPGGRIRYNDGAGGEPAAGGGIALATSALSNFEFDTLFSAVDYGTDGDLKLQMRLTGRNPDLESQRPVVLNLGVESNIPQLLNSLQAARAVEEIIKKRAEQ
ncbi:MAG TPA: YdbH domain-containing protein, partial [Gammaproteobacteria bacterium]|nr:YdbH domain-containing protein [Gammaproteobacteria bacterium]